MTPERFPLADLEVAVAGRRLSLSEVAALFRTTKRNASRWRSAGLSDRQADHLAVAVGLHPGAVWGDWWVSGAEVAA